MHDGLPDLGLEYDIEKDVHTPLKSFG
jgi:hypothetical protein